MGHPAPLPADTATALAVRIGYASSAGPRERNEDFVGCVTPPGEELHTKGILAAVADGVSGNAGGREAAEYTVRSLLADYYATPDTWAVPMALDKVIGAANRWVIAHAAAHRNELAGMATTLSALVLRGARYQVAHVGDTRVYRQSGGRFEQLTQDHVWDRPDMRHVLRRAVGLDTHLAVDYADGELEPGDVFVICSDGVWEPLGPDRMQAILRGAFDPQRAADALVEGALAAGGQDNASAMVLYVDRVPPLSWRDALSEARALPVPARLKPGQQIDGFEVLDLLHESRATLLYRVRQIGSGRVLALKTLQPALSDDRESCEGLLAEEWLSKRIVSSYFPQVVPLPLSARSCLYYVMSFHDGGTLQQQLDHGRHFSIGETADIGTQIAKGLSALHRLSIVHRDVKPANVLQGPDASVRILDLGVALAAGVPYPELAGNPGTPSYMAPELFAGEGASVRSDLYAAGVTLYHLLTRKYPYGEIEPFQTPRFGEPIPPTRYRPDVPAWLENLILKAIARDPQQRFETAEELLVAFEHGDARPLSAPRRTPVLDDPVLRWRAAALVMLVVNLLLLYYVLVR
jgi:protein phosphatase